MVEERFPPEIHPRLSISSPHLPLRRMQELRGTWSRRKTFPTAGGAGTKVALNAVALSIAAQAFQPRIPPCIRCPFTWIGYRGRCYHFSEAEGNWTSSRDNCSALGASLAVFEDPEDTVRTEVASSLRGRFEGSGYLRMSAVGME